MLPGEGFLIQPLETAFGRTFEGCRRLLDSISDWNFTGYADLCRYGRKRGIHAVELATVVAGALWKHGPTPNLYSVMVQLGTEYARLGQDWREARDRVPAAGKSLLPAVVATLWKVRGDVAVECRARSQVAFQMAHEIARWLGKVDDALECWYHTRGLVPPPVDDRYEDLKRRGVCRPFYDPTTASAFESMVARRYASQVQTFACSWDGVTAAAGPLAPEYVGARVIRPSGSYPSPAAAPSRLPVFLGAGRTRAQYRPGLSVQWSTELAADMRAIQGLDAEGEIVSALSDAMQPVIIQQEAGLVAEIAEDENARALSVEVDRQIIQDVFAELDRQIVQDLFAANGVDIHLEVSTFRLRAGDRVEYVVNLEDLADSLEEGTHAYAWDEERDARVPDVGVVGGLEARCAQTGECRRAHFGSTLYRLRGEDALLFTMSGLSSLDVALQSLEEILKDPAWQWSCTTDGG